MTTPTPPSDTERLLAERYGLRRRRPRWQVLGVMSVLAIAGLAWLGWAAWSAADPEVEADIVTWEVVSPHEVEVELLVHRDGTEAVSCTVVAQAADASVVGETPVDVAAGDSGEQRLNVTIATEREATAVKLSSCS